MTSVHFYLASSKRCTVYSASDFLELYAFSCRHQQHQQQQQEGEEEEQQQYQQKEGQLWQERQLWHIETTVFISHSRDFVGVSGIILTITRARYDASSVTCLDLQHLFCTSCMQIWHSDRLATQLNKGILAHNFQHYSCFTKKNILHPPQDTTLCVFCFQVK